MTESQPVQRKPGYTGNAWMRIFGALMATVAVLELVLCFAGPLAFTRKPKLIVFPPFGSQLSEQEASDLSSYLEKQIALSNSYSIVSRSFLEEYFIRTTGAFDRNRLKPVDYDEAHKTARELEMERFAICAVYRNSRTCEVSVTIREVQTGEIVKSAYFVADSPEDFLQGAGSSGQPLDIAGNLSTKTPGIGMTDYLVMALLVLQLILGALVFSGRELRVLAEVTWGFALVLFVFAFIFAKSANMDYVQRFIATSGELRLARSTALEQLYAAVRFGPLLILNAAYYVWRVLRRKSWERGRAIPGGWLTGSVTSWALFWVVLSAILFAFSFPSFLSLDGLGPLAWIAMVPLFVVLATVKPSRGVFYGVLFGTLQALVVNYWHGTYDYVSLHLITIVFVVEYLAFMVALAWLLKSAGKWGFLLLPAFWTLFDYLRSIGVTGYPWGLTGTSQYRFLPFIQVASLAGVWALGFVVVLVNASIAWALVAPARGWTWGRRRSGVGSSRLAFGQALEAEPAARKSLLTRLRVLLEKAPYLTPVGISGAVLVLCLIVGGIILHRVEQRLYGPASGRSATIVLLQQNTDPRRYEYRENFIKIRELTLAALATLEAPPDLVVWPEGGFKLDIRYWSEEERKDSYWGRVVQEFLAFQKGLDSWLLTGTQDHGTEPLQGGEERAVNFNSSVLLDRDAQIRGFFHKMRLVPFSEYFPLDKEKYGGVYEIFAKFGISGWGVGRERTVFQHEKMRFFTPICFEDVFSDHARRFVLQGVDVIINMSNDYWSLSPVEGRQHAILALFRTVENQRPLLRSTSSGYTVYVDAAGRIQPGAPEPYTEGYLVAHVPLPERHLTLYTRWGDWFPLTCAGAVPILVFVGLLDRRRTRRRLARGVIGRVGGNGHGRVRIQFCLDGEPLEPPGWVEGGGFDGPVEGTVVEPARVSGFAGRETEKPVGAPGYPIGPADGPGRTPTRPCSRRR